MNDEQEGRHREVHCRNDEQQAQDDEMSQGRDDDDDDDDTSSTPSTAPMSEVPSCSSCSTFASQTVGRSSGQSDIHSYANICIPPFIVCDRVGSDVIDGTIDRHCVIMKERVLMTDLQQIDELAATEKSPTLGEALQVTIMCHKLHECVSELPSDISLEDDNDVVG